ncbi:hypothetical protein [Cellvibrio sp. PSBB006]|uniref:hypothetical protein n=1 Tax=Cellvibrio sp. PSBB006 TaxID=1987723 RepID=UPI000B3B196E|nr:hypothetical protein [Cellvibrio sp. PSBB006]ARU28456.1 hypothetical protein CBR65_13970 [Cellvibrio sp. PSBB006]
MTTGLALVEAISKNKSLQELADCGSVPAEIGRAVYTKYQTDRDDISITLKESEEEIRNAIANAIALPENLNRIGTAVWHFQTLPGCHHFVAIPWQTQEGTPTWVYSIFMAYVNMYTLGDYINGKNPAPSLPPAGNGFRTYWTQAEFETMLLDLLRHGDSWQRYFGKVETRKALSIKINKYPFIRLDIAIQRVKTFVK